ncbi:DUF1415 domain-containing protein [Methylibium sp.]|uniref:DUF1415 domain-containing protein n=1 Tax=Methylibium sp. TaxID=2067992 RepID=UPI0017B858A9|nr:DUF1415 domain-containing protein [Methylibium sp.]MBA3589848.1 DUF1415 domain-containing protein [Methylibium sp.]
MERRKVPLAPDAGRVIAETRAWVERAVVGLNLCPFARAVHVRQQIRYAVSDAPDAEALLEALVAEMHALVAADPARIDTTLLIHPRVLGDFTDYNDFLQVADAALSELNLEGVLQVASFHPHYRFAGTTAQDVTNATNRSPYPTLHLLREASVDRAVAAFPDASAIYEANLVSLRALGSEGWASLQAQCRRDAADEGAPARAG